jgi:hypothetical protein
MLILVLLIQIRTGSILCFATLFMKIKGTNKNGQSRDIGSTGYKTQNVEKQNKKAQYRKLKHDTHKKRCTRNVNRLCFLPVTCNSYSQSLVGDEEKKRKSRGKVPLLFEKLIFRNGQLVRDDECIILLMMPSTLLHCFT